MSVDDEQVVNDSTGASEWTDGLAHVRSVITGSDVPDVEAVETSVVFHFFPVPFPFAIFHHDLKRKPEYCNTRFKKIRIFYRLKIRIRFFL